MSIEQLSFLDSWGFVLSSWLKLKFDWCDLSSVEMSMSKRESGAGIISSSQEHKT